jgi:hypothetical protein
MKGDTCLFFIRNNRNTPVSGISIIRQAGYRSVQFCYAGEILAAVIIGKAVVQTLCSHISLFKSSGKKWPKQKSGYSLDVPLPYRWKYD